MCGTIETNSPLIIAFLVDVSHSLSRMLFLHQNNNNLKEKNIDIIVDLSR